MKLDRLQRPTEKRFFYARLPGYSQPRKLTARVFYSGQPNPPLLVWLHSGGFHTGSIEHPIHLHIASEFAAQGIATAFIEYRLRCRTDMLSTQAQTLLPLLEEDAAQHDFGLKSFLTGSAALGTVESAIVFLRWLALKGPRHGLRGPIMIGGSSAGAITVLNTLALAPRLGIRLPRIQAAYCMSGAFAYPNFLTPNPTPILAMHNPRDMKVPIASIRAYAERPDTNVTLIEGERHPHGGINRYRREPFRHAVARMVQFANAGVLTEPA